jgi:crotonobetainyl-CoA:carnitine CoA-transferase CaiB-like acyl-CoA transferase
LIPLLKEVLARLPQAEVEGRCERANISWSPVGKPDDLFADRHLMANGGLLDVFTAPVGGEHGLKVKLPALPIAFGEGRPGLVRQPPRMGEHSAAVLAEAGFAPAEIAALARQCVIVAAP